MSKADHYAAKIYNQIAELFSADCENFIDRDDFEDDENTTAFFHALANIAPALLYVKLSGDDVDMLGFNHMANRLCVQNIKMNNELSS